MPRLIQIDLAFHRNLIELAESRRLIDLWSSLNGQIGALVLRSLEQLHANIDDVAAFHQRLLVPRAPLGRSAAGAVTMRYVVLDT